MTIQTIRVGFLQANSYLLIDEKSGEAVLIDPGDEPRKLISEIEKSGAKLKYIVVTHSHPDHVGALLSVKEYFKVPDQNCLGGGFKDAEIAGEIKLGNETLKFIATPGHKPDSVCVVWEKGIFTGDTLFRNAIGRTDFEGGDDSEMERSLAKLASYPDDFKIYPGHGPESTIGEEKKHNPYLR